MVKFDWYQCTVVAPVNDLLESLYGLSPTAHLTHARGMHGYATASTFTDDSGPIAKVLHGGSHQNPHVIFSGPSTPPGVDLVRSLYPVHGVSRADAALDMEGPDTYDLVQVEALAIAAQRRVKVGTAGDHLLTKEGRTLYLGAPSSVAFVRLYDKAAELRSKFRADPVRLQDVPDHLTRLEVQVRPKSGPSKLSVSTMEPQALFGASTWSQELWERVSGSCVERVHVGSVYRQSDDDRAWSFMLAQYGPLLLRRAQEAGSWDLVGRDIGHDLKARQLALQ